MAELKSVWIVIDPIEETDTPGEICWEQDAATLDDQIAGGRAGDGRFWKKRHVKYYTDEGSAQNDADKRMAKFKKKAASAEAVVERFKG